MMTYGEIFQCLKGVGRVDLQDLALVVEGTSYALHPICCQMDGTSPAVLEMLTVARNSNSNSFLTYFTATPERTRKWLTSEVGMDSSRILFVLRETRTNSLYGFMGLAYGDKDGQRIEGDAIVRYANNHEPGLMQRAFLTLVTWVTQSLGVKEVWVRVLSDNPAVAFYQRCSFVALWQTDLFELRNSRGELEALTESDDSGKLALATRTLTYMRYSPHR